MQHLQEQTGWNFIPNLMPPDFNQNAVEAVDSIHKGCRNSHGMQDLGVNAGHDLNLDNLRYFHQNIPWIEEVSIGHALISDALYLGLENTIQMYKGQLT